MKRLVFTLVIVLAIVITAMAQPPQAFKYQAVVRDNNGDIIQNQNVSLRISIHDGYSTGTVIYQEIHSAITNQFGLVSVDVGTGTPVTGYFSSIDWANGSKYLETELDPAGGSNYTSMGTTQLLSVPYALYSGNTANGDNLGNHIATQNINLNGHMLTGNGSIYLNQAPEDGLNIYKAGNPSTFSTNNLNNGLEIDGAEGSGVYIGQSDNDGIHIRRVGNTPSFWSGDPDNSGLEIETTEGNGIYIGHSYKNGMQIGGAEKNGILIDKCDEDGVKVSSTGPTAFYPSADTNGFEIGGTVGNGVYVGIAHKDGLHVHMAGNIENLYESDFNNGLEIEGAEGYGVFVGNTDKTGVYVNNAEEDGIVINSVGNPAGGSISPSHNGVEIQGVAGNGVFVGNAGGSGLNVDYAGDCGVDITNAEFNGLMVGYAGSDGLYIQSADDDGVSVYSASDNGVEISTAGNNGLYLGHSIGDGIHIVKAGNPSFNTYSNSYSDGIEIEGAQGNGVIVGNTELNGLSVIRAAQDGLHMFRIGNQGSSYPDSYNDGIEIEGVEGNGLYVGVGGHNGAFIYSVSQDGIYVNSAGDDGVQVQDATWYGFWANGVGHAAFDGSTNNASNEWGLYTPDKVHALNVTSKSNSTYGKNIGSESLEPGDIVCIAGGVQQDVLSKEGIPAVNIEKAGKDNSKAVFGVVEYKVVIGEHNKGADMDGQPVIIRQFEHADGNVSPGEYLSVVVFGQAEVNIDSKEPLKAGDALVAGNNGAARKVKTTEINGITIAENTGIIGKVLENSPGKGKTLVFVNCK